MNISANSWSILIPILAMRITSWLKSIGINVSRQKLAFASVMGGSSAMNNIFITYYLLYFGASGLSTSHFLIAQSLFACWNALNDLLAGSWSDRLVATTNRSRGRMMAIAGCIWSIIFMFMWYPVPSLDSKPQTTSSSWTSIWAALQFAFILCTYDTGLTVTELNHAALLADAASDPGTASTWNGAASIAAAAGSASSWLAAWAWGSEIHTPARFAYTCTCVGAACCVLFLWVGSVFSQTKQKSKAISPGDTPDGTWKRLSRQLLRMPNFRRLAILSVLQTAVCAFEKSFFAPFLLTFAGKGGSDGKAMPAHVQGLVVSASFLLPHALAVALVPAIRRLGVANINWRILWIRGGLTIAAVTMGLPSSPMLAAAFLLTNRVLSECICRLNPLLLADVVAEDAVEHARAHSVAASIGGILNFLSKAGQSIGPMLAVAMLPAGAWAPAASAGAASDASPGMDPASLAQTWRVCVGLPACIVLCQLAVWQGYSLSPAQAAMYRDRMQRQRDAAV